MNARYIRELAKILSESNVDEIEVRSWWRRLRISRNSHASVAQPVVAAATQVPVEAAASVPSVEPAAPESASAPSDDGLVPVTAPMVGTFYRAPAPDASAYVDVGSTIDTDTVVCIVEAMKLMNEIEAGVAGTVRKVLVENGTPVEFDQALFLIEPA
jgi:acetyl-CoA carboxylase biotin carboxyl carrier protein